MFPTKHYWQNDRNGSTGITCFYRKLDPQLDVPFKSWFSPYPRLLVHFVCLINSFYRRYLSCGYNICLICPVYRMYCPYLIHRVCSDWLDGRNINRTRPYITFSLSLQMYSLHVVCISFINAFIIGQDPCCLGPLIGFPRNPAGRGQGFTFPGRAAGLGWLQGARRLAPGPSAPLPLGIL